MTLWNPRNLFSSPEHRNGIAPSASFDPSSTGDPVGPGSSLPSIGFGSTGTGGAARVGDPQRRPIGFAPPADDRPEPRYSTELSFKRHRSTPRASTAPAQPSGEAPEPWQTPDLSSPESDVSDVSDADSVGTLAETEPAKAVPFYKREIGFGRKRAAVAEAPVVAEAAEPAEDDAELVAAVEESPASDQDLPVADAVADAHAGADAHADADVDAVAGDESDSPDADALVDETETAKVVPFYKREINLGRKRSKGAAEPVAAAVAATEALEVNEAVADRDDVVANGDASETTDTTEEAEAPEAVPFYRREISLRRKPQASGERSDLEGAALVAAAVESDDIESVEAEVAAGPESAEVENVVSDAESQPVLESRLEPVSEGDEAGADVAEEPVVAEAVSENEIDEAVEPEPVQAEVVEPEVVASEVVETEPSLEEAGPVEEPLNDTSPASSPEMLEEPTAEPVDAPPAAADEQDAPTAGADAPHADVQDEVEKTPGKEAPGRFAGRKAKRSTRKGGSSKKGRRVVGLKIGASQIAAAVVHETDAGRELVELARRPLSHGIVIDGEVRDPVALTAALKAFFEDEKLPRKDVRIGVSSNRIGVRTFEIVGMADEKQFDNAVRFRAHELLPVAVSESVLDYRVLDERTNADGEIMRRVLLVVAPRDQVEPYARVANDAGLSIAAIDLEAFALLRAFVEPKSATSDPAGETATVVVAIGHESSTLLVAGGGTCEFTRVFDWGGGDLEEAIASALEVDRAEAATILAHLSLSGPGRMHDSLDESTRTRAVEAIRLRLTPFARELVNSLQFYQTQAESLGIGGIVVTGGTSHLEGLDAALQQMIGVDVEIGDPLGRVIPVGTFDPAVEALIGSLAVPIGLAIDDTAVRGVNLVPGGSAKTKKSPRARVVAIGAPAAVAIPLVALGFLYVGASGTVSDRESQLDAIAAEVASLPEPTTPRIAPDIVGAEAVRATAVASVLGGRVAWDSVFRDLSRILPDNVWLQTLSVSQPDAAAPAGAAAAPVLPGQPGAAPSAVKIDGFTYEQPDVARLLARLAVVPSLTRVTLVSSEKSTVAEEDVVHFVIVADLKNAGGAS